MPEKTPGRPVCTRRRPLRGPRNGRAPRATGHTIPGAAALAAESTGRTTPQPRRAVQADAGRRPLAFVPSCLLAANVAFRSAKGRPFAERKATIIAIIRSMAEPAATADDFLRIGPHVRVLPIVHGSGDFAVCVREELLARPYDCLAVPLPPSFQKQVEAAIDRLPPVPAALQQDAEGDGFRCGPIDRLQPG